MAPDAIGTAGRSAALALTSALVMAVIGCLNLRVSPSLAPRVNVRWAAGASDAVRAESER